MDKGRFKMDEGTRTIMIAASITIVVGFVMVAGFLGVLFVRDIDWTPDDDGGPYNGDGGLTGEYPGPLSGEMLAYWKFDEGSWDGANYDVADSSGNGNHGLRRGTVEPIPGGVTGNTAHFDGNGNIRVFDDGQLDITSEFTISAWIRTGAKDQYLAITDRHHLIQDSGSDTIESGYSFYLTDGKVRLSIYSGRSGQRSALGVSDLRDSKWHHVVGTWDGVTIKVYADGVLEDENVWVYPPESSTARLSIGIRLEGWGGYMPFRGLMDEVCIYGKALRQDNITG